MEAGQLLKERRNECGYTLEQLAHAVGVTTSAVAQWEAGRTKPRRSAVERVDAELRAGGSLMQAFGYVVPGDPLAALRLLVADLSETVRALARQVEVQGDAIVRLQRAVAPGSAGSHPVQR